MIHTTLEGGVQLAESLTVKLRAVGESIHRSMLHVAIFIQRYVITEKLEGQALRHRTGHLERSTVQRVEGNGDTWTAIIGTGKEAPYGKVHEFGGTFTIREHLARSKQGRSFLVREHTATFPERSYLRSSLREQTGRIRDMLEEDILKAVVEA